VIHVIVSPEISNINVDAFATSYFVHFRVLCNYPGAVMESEFVIQNVTIFDSQIRLAMDPLILMAAPANISLINLELLNQFTYSTSGIPPIEIIHMDSCTPNDNLLQTYTFAKISLTMPENPYNNQGTGIFLNTSPNIYRTQTITAQNFLIK
jgi:hypothetical protein